MKIIAIIVFLVINIICTIIITNQFQKSKKTNGTFAVNAEDDTLIISIDNSAFTSETITSMKYLVLENKFYSKGKGSK